MPHVKSAGWHPPTVERRPLGATGLEVGEIGLGAWQLGGSEVWNGPDEAESVAIVDAAVAAGAQVLEVLLNAFHQEPRPALRRAQAAGVGVIVKVPLDSGWLGGRYRAGASFDGVRARWSEEVIARRAGLVERFEALLPDGVTTARGALGFLLAQTPVSSVIPGAKSVTQLQENVAAAGERLPEATVAAIEQLW